MPEQCMCNSMQQRITFDAKGLLQDKANLHAQTSHNTEQVQTETAYRLDMPGQA